MKALLLVAVFAAMASVAAAQPPAPPNDRVQKRPMTLDDLYKFKRVADPQVSPDGKLVAYQLTEILDPDANKTQTHIWVAATDGQSPPRQLTSSGKRDAHPRWSPDGTKILFESTRSGSQQLWVLDLKNGGEAKQVTKVSTGAGTGVWSPDGSHVAFVSAVHPEFSSLPFAESDAKNKEKDEATEKGPVKAKVFTKLFFRHWDEYVGDKRQHLFVCTAAGDDCHDATPGDRDANPTSSTFSVGDDFCFSPDGMYLIFTAVPAKGEAWTTDYNLCRVRVTNNSGGPASGRDPTDWETLTADNKGADNGPRFSPDGKKMAYRSQKKAGYEADRWVIHVADVNPDGTFAGPPKPITHPLTWGAGVTLGGGVMQPVVEDVSVNEVVWLGNDSLLFNCDAGGAHTVYKVPATGGNAHHYPVARQVSGLMVAKDVLAFAKSGLDTPNDIYVSTGADPMTAANVSGANAKLLAELDRPRPESVAVPVEGDVKMQMWVLKPPGFDASKKYPLVYLIHGGPQGAWEDGWSFRWCPQMWAAQGYVVAMPNPRGSTGFGQKFVDEISGDWGGKCYRDLVAGLEQLKKLPYIDSSRMASAGASFGGYMQDWFAVNEIAKEFKCLITHCSVYNFESMWGTTDELWFDEYEHGGLPWEIPGKYREFSPHTKAGNLSKYKTPMLVIHNDLDFRCPIGQGHELFAALQRQGVPSRFVNFPDEGHWVTKPANGKFWHKEVFAWLNKYAPPGGK